MFADAVQQHASPGSFALVSFDTIRPPPIRIEMREGGDLHYSVSFDTTIGLFRQEMPPRIGIPSLPSSLARWTHGMQN